MPDETSRGFLDVYIETERLRPVPINDGQAPEIFTSFTAEITRYMHPRPAENISETRQFIDKSRGELIARVSLVMAILTKAEGELLGCGGLHEANTVRPILGIWLKKSAHHMGYGREAIAAIVDWARKHLCGEGFRYPVDKRNLPSRRIPEALGGRITRKFKSINMSGVELDEIEYLIPW